MPEPRIELGAALQQHDALPVGYVATFSLADKFIVQRPNATVTRPSGYTAKGTSDFAETDKFIV